MERGTGSVLLKNTVPWPWPGLACVAADSFPFSGGAEIEQANEKRASEGARLGWAKKFPPVRKRLEKERKRLLRRLDQGLTIRPLEWFKVLHTNVQVTALPIVDSPSQQWTYVGGQV